MIVQYCSDLHLEFKENESYLKENPIKPLGEILIMAGDILPLILLDKPCCFLDYVSDHFERVYWVPGNHEYYHFDLADVKTPLNEKIRENVILINNQTLIYKNMELIFSTLWSHVLPQFEYIVQQSVNDFHLIKQNAKTITSKDFNALHKTDFVFIKHTLAKPTDKKRIVITHHVPSLMHYPEQYKTSTINSAFAVELHDFILESSADFWIYGHHHCNTVDFKIGKTCLLTNQLGYVSHNEHKTFKHDAIIDLL